MSAVVVGMPIGRSVNFERLEECVSMALKSVRPGARPVLLAKMGGSP